MNFNLLILRRFAEEMYHPHFSFNNKFLNTHKNCNIFKFLIVFVLPT